MDYQLATLVVACVTCLLVAVDLVIDWRAARPARAKISLDALVDDGIVLGESMKAAHKNTGRVIDDATIHSDVAAWVLEQCRLMRIKTTQAEIGKRIKIRYHRVKASR